MRFRRATRSAFTLIELLVVIAIIATLIGLLLPAVQKVREAAARMSCQNNLKQCALGVHLYQDANQKLPHGAQGGVLPNPNPVGNTTMIAGTTWLVLILPNVEQGNLYSRYSFAIGYNTGTNVAVGAERVPIYYCPAGAKVLSANSALAAELNANTTHYYGIMGPGTGTGYPMYSQASMGAVPHNSAYSNPPSAGMLIYFEQGFGVRGNVTISDVTDGTSNTIMIGERSQNHPTGVANDYLSWIRGNNDGSGATKNLTYQINSPSGFYNNSNNLNDLAMGSNHPGGANFALGDGSVRYINQSIDYNTFIASASINGKEVISLP